MKKGFQKVPLNLFAKKGIDIYCLELVDDMKKEIENADESYILNIDDKEYTTYLINKYSIDTPIINFEQATVGGEEARSSMATFFDDPTFVITYDIPFTGDHSFLEYAPLPSKDRKKASATREVLSVSSSININTWDSWNSDPGAEDSVSKESNYIVFVRENAYYNFDFNGEIIQGAHLCKHLLQNMVKDAKNAEEAESNRDFHSYYYVNRDNFLKNADEAKEALKDIGFLYDLFLHLEVNCVQSNQKAMESQVRKAFYDFKALVKRLTTDIEKHNEHIRKNAAKFYQNRKQRLIKHNKILSSIGLPIRVRANIPLTYAIPTEEIRKKIYIEKPSVPEKGFVSEPMLEQEIYYHILKTIHDIGKVMERLPSIHRDRHEEDLRDLLLLYLEPRYEGSATGETFNGGGKTDILIRHQNTNVFIAECKMWHGSKEYLSGISQLLGNLVWRDSKAAMIIFVRNKEISLALQSVREETLNHPNYVGLIKEEDDSWLNYRFHLNNDPGREIKLAVLLFHIPAK